MMSRFRVKNYKALADIDIALSKIHVLIGQNDSGKTSLLEAVLAFCRSTTTELHTCFEGRWEARELVYLAAKEPKITFSSLLEAGNDGTAAVREYGFTVGFQDAGGSSCALEREWFSTLEDDTREMPRGHRGFTVVALGQDPANEDQINHAIKEVSELLGPVWFCRFEPRLMAIPASFDDTRKLRMDADGFGLSTLLDDILGYDAERFLQLSKEFCELFPEFRRVRLQTEMAFRRLSDPSGLQSRDRMIGKAIYLETRDGGVIRAQQASDGAILFLGFLALLYLPSPPKILLIEEPEKGVYPKRLEEIVGLLKRVITGREGDDAPQVIFTTHSPFILSQFTPEEVTLMSRRNGYVLARSLRDAPHIMERLGGGEFYLGELWYNLDEEELFQDAGADSRH